jgi:non-ribosomal peptide synthetase component F
VFQYKRLRPAVAECEVCGRYYDELTFQLVLRETARGFDSVECALRAQEALVGADNTESSVNHKVQGVLEQLEQTAAALFAARAELGAERRRSRRLEERAARLAVELDGFANAAPAATN